MFSEEVGGCKLLTELLCLKCVDQSRWALEKNNSATNYLQHDMPRAYKFSRHLHLVRVGARSAHPRTARNLLRILLEEKGTQHIQRLKPFSLWCTKDSTPGGSYHIGPVYFWILCWAFFHCACAYIHKNLKERILFSFLKRKTHFKKKINERSFMYANIFWSRILTFHTCH